MSSESYIGLWLTLKIWLIIRNALPNPCKNTYNKNSPKACPLKRLYWVNINYYKMLEFLNSIYFFSSTIEHLHLKLLNRESKGLYHAFLAPQKALKITWIIWKIIKVLLKALKIRWKIINVLLKALKIRWK